MILFFIFIKLQASKKLHLVILSSPFLISCVGPVTPFGALNNVQSHKTIKGGNDLNGANLEISITPKRQNLHNRGKINISIFDPEGIPKTAKVNVYYNNRNVTKTFFKYATSKKQEHIWDLEFRKLKLIGSKDHEIYFEYKKNKNDSLYTFSWDKPNCHTYDPQAKLANTSSFSPSKKIVTSIKNLSKLYKVNPALTAGLIAQESGFNPKAISWAKAIGLTQVTPIADLEIKKYHQNWPRSPEINKLPVSLLKPLIRLDKITPIDDWRLNPKLSIEGGLSYLRHITSYWYLPKNKKLLINTGLTSEDDLNGVILASYNSGGARVGNAIRKKGKKYLNYKTLKEAKKYVSRIKSYCYHFGQGESL